MRAACEICGTAIETYPSKPRRFCSMACRNRPFAATYHERISVQDGGCWRWLGHINANGYGTAVADGRQQGAHRLVYELLVAPIPAGLTLDHLCRVRACVNPDHLEPVTHRENILRGEAQAARNARKTHCKRGHAFTPGNTGRTKRGGRYCKTCSRAAARAQHALKRATVQAADREAVAA